MDELVIKLEDILAEAEAAAGLEEPDAAVICENTETANKKGKYERKKEPKINAATIIEFSYVCPFRSKNNSYLCFYCPTSFFDPKDLREHTRSHPIDPKAIYRNLPKHGRPGKIDTIAIDCRLCGEKITDIATLKTHLATSHSIQFRNCSDGILEFKLSKDVMNCVMCEKSFNAFNILNNHMNTHFDTFICEICATGFMSYPRLRTHRQTHTLDKYPCGLCEKVFTSSLKRRKHVQIFHRKKTDTKCPECNEVFKDAKKRVRHQVEAHGKLAKRYECNACDKVFKASNMLSLHVRRDHKHERRYECPHCDRKFFSHQFMKEHVARHQGQLFQCEVCSNSFKWKRSLIRHMRMHESSRFACAVCGEFFSRDSSLKKHLKIHIYATNTYDII